MKKRDDWEYRKDRENRKKKHKIKTFGINSLTRCYKNGTCDSLCWGTVTFLTIDIILQLTQIVNS